MAKKKQIYKKDAFLIEGGSFRLLVWDLYDLYCHHFSLVRRLSEAKTEKEFLRLQKQVSGYEHRMKRFCRLWGLPTDDTPWAYDTMEESIRTSRLIPLYEEPEETFSDIPEEYIYE